MISIRANFFYTRSVPCELWFFDRAKPAERKDKVLMLDARNVFRKVTRKIYDFSPEQTKNLAAIVWLYRGQRTASWHWCGTTSVPSAPRARPSRQSSLPLRRRLPTCAAVSLVSFRA